MPVSSMVDTTSNAASGASPTKAKRKIALPIATLQKMFIKATPTPPPAPAPRISQPIAELQKVITEKLIPRAGVITVEQLQQQKQQLQQLHDHQLSTNDRSHWSEPLRKGVPIRQQGMTHHYSPDIYEPPRLPQPPSEEMIALDRPTAVLKTWEDWGFSNVHGLDENDEEHFRNQQHLYVVDGSHHAKAPEEVFGRHFSNTLKDDSSLLKTADGPIRRPVLTSNLHKTREVFEQFASSHIRTGPHFLDMKESEGEDAESSFQHQQDSFERKHTREHQAQHLNGGGNANNQSTMEHDNNRTVRRPPDEIVHKTRDIGRIFDTNTFDKTPQAIEKKRVGPKFFSSSLQQSWYKLKAWGHVPDETFNNQCDLPDREGGGQPPDRLVEDLDVSIRFGGSQQTDRGLQNGEHWMEGNLLWADADDVDDVVDQNLDSSDGENCGFQAKHDQPTGIQRLKDDLNGIIQFQSSKDFSECLEDGSRLEQVLKKSPIQGEVDSHDDNDLNHPKENPDETIQDTADNAQQMNCSSTGADLDGSIIFESPKAAPRRLEYRDQLLQGHLLWQTSPTPSDVADDDGVAIDRLEESMVFRMQRATEFEASESFAYHPDPGHLNIPVGECVEHVNLDALKPDRSTSDHNASEIAVPHEVEDRNTSGIASTSPDCGNLEPDFADVTVGTNDSALSDQIINFGDVDKLHDYRSGGAGGDTILNDMQSISNVDVEDLDALQYSIDSQETKNSSEGIVAAHVNPPAPSQIGASPLDAIHDDIDDADSPAIVYQEYRGLGSDLSARPEETRIAANEGSLKRDVEVVLDETYPKGNKSPLERDAEPSFETDVSSLPKEMITQDQESSLGNESTVWRDHVKQSMNTAESSDYTKGPAATTIQQKPMRDPVYQSSMDETSNALSSTYFCCDADHSCVDEDEDINSEVSEKLDDVDMVEDEDEDIDSDASERDEPIVTISDKQGINGAREMSVNVVDVNYLPMEIGLGFGINLDGSESLMPREAIVDEIAGAPEPEAETAESEDESLFTMDAEPGTAGAISDGIENDIKLDSEPTSQANTKEISSRINEEIELERNTPANTEGSHGLDLDHCSSKTCNQNSSRQLIGVATPQAKENPAIVVDTGPVITQGTNDTSTLDSKEEIALGHHRCSHRDSTPLELTQVDPEGGTEHARATSAGMFIALENDVTEDDDDAAKEVPSSATLRPIDSDASVELEFDKDPLKLDYEEVPTQQPRNEGDPESDGEKHDASTSEAEQGEVSSVLSSLKSLNLQTDKIESMARDAGRVGTAATSSQCDERIPTSAEAHAAFDECAPRENVHLEKITAECDELRSSDSLNSSETSVPQHAVGISPTRPPPREPSTMFSRVVGRIGAAVNKIPKPTLRKVTESGDTDPRGELVSTAGSPHCYSSKAENTNTEMEPRTGDQSSGQSLSKKPAIEDAPKWNGTGDFADGSINERNESENDSNQDTCAEYNNADEQRSVVDLTCKESDDCGAHPMRPVVDEKSAGKSRAAEGMASIARAFLPFGSSSKARVISTENPSGTLDSARKQAMADVVIAASNAAIAIQEPQSDDRQAVVSQTQGDDGKDARPELSTQSSIAAKETALIVLHSGDSEQGIAVAPNDPRAEVEATKQQLETEQVGKNDAAADAVTVDADKATSQNGGTNGNIEDSNVIKFDLGSKMDEAQDGPVVPFDEESSVDGSITAQDMALIVTACLHFGEQVGDLQPQGSLSCDQFQTNIMALTANRYPVVGNPVSHVDTIDKTVNSSHLDSGNIDGSGLLNNDEDPEREGSGRNQLSSRTSTRRPRGTSVPNQRKSGSSVVQCEDRTSSATSSSSVHIFRRSSGQLDSTTDLSKSDSSKEDARGEKSPSQPRKGSNRSTEDRYRDDRSRESASCPTRISTESHGSSTREPSQHQKGSVDGSTKTISHAKGSSQRKHRSTREYGHESKVGEPSVSLHGKTKDEQPGDSPTTKMTETDLERQPQIASDDGSNRRYSKSRERSERRQRIAFESGRDSMMEGDNESTRSKPLTRYELSHSNERSNEREKSKHAKISPEVGSTAALSAGGDASGRKNRATSESNRNTTLPRNVAKRESSNETNNSKHTKRPCDRSIDVTVSRESEATGLKTNASARNKPRTTTFKVSSRDGSREIAASRNEPSGQSADTPPWNHKADESKDRPTVTGRILQQKAPTGEGSHEGSHSRRELGAGHRNNPDTGHDSKRMDRSSSTRSKQRTHHESASNATRPKDDRLENDRSNREGHRPGMRVPEGSSKSESSTDLGERYREKPMNTDDDTKSRQSRDRVVHSMDEQMAASNFERRDQREATSDPTSIRNEIKQEQSESGKENESGNAAASQDSGYTDVPQQSATADRRARLRARRIARNPVSRVAVDDAGLEVSPKGSGTAGSSRRVYRTTSNDSKLTTEGSIDSIGSRRLHRTTSNSDSTQRYRAGLSQAAGIGGVGGLTLNPDPESLGKALAERQGRTRRLQHAGMGDILVVSGLIIAPEKQTASRRLSKAQPQSTSNNLRDIPLDIGGGIDTETRRQQRVALASKGRRSSLGVRRTAPSRSGSNNQKMDDLNSSIVSGCEDDGSFDPFGLQGSVATMDTNSISGGSGVGSNSAGNPITSPGSHRRTTSSPGRDASSTPTGVASAKARAPQTALERRKRRNLSTDGMEELAPIFHKARAEI